MRPLGAAVLPFGGRAALFIAFLAVALLACCAVPPEKSGKPQPVKVCSEIGSEALEDDSLCAAEQPASEEHRNSLIQQANSERNGILAGEEEEQQDDEDENVSYHRMPPPRRASSLLQARASSAAASVGAGIRATANATAAGTVAGAGSAAAAKGRGRWEDLASVGVDQRDRSDQEKAANAGRRRRASLLARLVAKRKAKTLMARLMLSMAEAALTATSDEANASKANASSASLAATNATAPATAPAAVAADAPPWSTFAASADGDGRGLLSLLSAAREHLSLHLGSSAASGQATTAVTPVVLAAILVPLLLLTCCGIMSGLNNKRPNTSPLGMSTPRAAPRSQLGPVGSSCQAGPAKDGRSSRRGSVDAGAGRSSFPSIYGGGGAPSASRTNEQWYGEWRSPSVGELRANPLCPCLLVPEGCECTLLLPKLTQSFFSDGRQLAISDPRGSPVMRVAYVGTRRSTLLSEGGTPRLPLDLPVTPGSRFRAVGRSARDQGSGSRLILSDMTDEVLAYCQDDKAVISIHSSQGLFASFQKTGSGSYEVKGQKPWKLNLVRRPMGGGSGLAVMDEGGQLLAVCEPSEEDVNARVVRIDANVDAGLVILNLLCTDLEDMP